MWLPIVLSLLFLFWVGFFSWATLADIRAPAIPGQSKNSIRTTIFVTLFLATCITMVPLGITLAIYFDSLWLLWLCAAGVIFLS